MRSFESVDEYIQSFPEPTKSLLMQMRELVLAAHPEIEEKIAYGMPAYRYKGVLVYFAGYARHIGFYPSGEGITAFEKRLSKFKSGKGSVQFPLDQPLPTKLIQDIVEHRVKENEKKERLKSRTKTK